MADPNIYTSKLNTGKITFDNGIKIIGALAGSSDGKGVDTIQLVPDIDTYNSHQYLVVEPIEDDTSIHIRAGGNVDDSGAKLVLGGSLTSIGLSDQSSERIVLSAKNEAENDHHEWTLNSSGATGFPIINADLHNESAPQLAEVLQFNSSQHQSVITNAVPPINVDAERIIIQGQRGTGTGEGGDVYLWGGDSTVNGGDIKIYAGDADSAGSGSGGYVNIKAGAGRTYGGAVNIAGGVSALGIAGEVSITSNASTWSFKNDGTTTFPTLTVDLHTGGSTSAETLKFSNNGLKSVITGPTPAASTAVKPIIIQGQSQTGAEGGDVYLWSGNGEGGGGNIELLAGNNENIGDGLGGHIYLQAGGGWDNGGDVEIRGGTSLGGNNGGSVAIIAGDGGGGDNGQVTIMNDSYSWYFQNDGNTTIPNLKDIRDISGNTAIGGGNRVKNYNSSSGSVVTVDESNIYAINTTTQATTVKLPSSGTTPIGYEFTVIDTIGNAASKNITVTAESGDLIVSAPSGIAINTNYGLLAFKYIGNKNWAILYGR